jgi:hypothetical protein
MYQKKWLSQLDDNIKAIHATNINKYRYFLFFCLSLFSDIQGKLRENGKVIKEWICAGYSDVVNGSNSTVRVFGKGANDGRFCWIDGPSDRFRG